MSESLSKQIVSVLILRHDLVSIYIEREKKTLFIIKETDLIFNQNFSIFFTVAYATIGPKMYVIVQNNR